MEKLLLLYIKYNVYIKIYKYIFICFNKYKNILQFQQRINICVWLHIYISFNLKNNYIVTHLIYFYNFFISQICNLLYNGAISKYVIRKHLWGRTKKIQKVGRSGGFVMIGRVLSPVLHVLFQTLCRLYKSSFRWLPLTNTCPMHCSVVLHVVQTH
jgi:hypothetical protein